MGGSWNIMEEGTEGGEGGTLFRKYDIVIVSVSLNMCNCISYLRLYCTETL
jgi:hypothetical protein